jgi:hypothetical protein
MVCKSVCGKHHHRRAWWTFQLCDLLMTDSNVLQLNPVLFFSCSQSEKKNTTIMEDEKVEPTNGDAIVANGQKDGDDVDAGTPAKRKRGRPPKAKSADDDEPAPKKPASGRGRGRPPKFPKATAADGSTSADANGDGNGDAGASAANAPKRKRGRPPKNSPASEITLAASATDATSAADTANVDQNAA